MRRAGEYERPREESERTEAQRERREPAPVADLLALQRTAGNRAVGSLLTRDTKTKDKPKEAAPVTGNRVVFPGVGTIPAESIQFGSGGGRGPGQPQREVREITVTSIQGEHSDALFRASLEGRAADVDVIVQGPGGQALVIKLKGAIVANYSVSSGGGDRPMESWTLDFNAIEFQREGEKKQSDDAGAGGDAYPG